MKHKKLIAWTNQQGEHSIDGGKKNSGCGELIPMRTVVAELSSIGGGKEKSGCGELISMSESLKRRQ